MAGNSQGKGVDVVKIMVNSPKECSMAGTKGDLWRGKERGGGVQAVRDLVSPTGEFGFHSEAAGSLQKGLKQGT